MSQATLTPRAGRHRALIALAATLLLFGTSGCLISSLFGGGKRISLTGAWGLAVFPVVFHFRVPQYQAFLRAQDLANRLNGTTGVVIYGPADFHVLDPAEGDIGVGSDLMTAIRYTKTRPPMGLYAIRITVDRPGITEADQDTLEQQGGDPNALIAGADITVKGDLLSLGDHTVVTSITTPLKLDNVVVEDIGMDTYPQITETCQNIVDKLIRIGGLQGKSKPDMGMGVVSVLGPAAAFHLPGKKNLVTEMASLDAIEREVILSGLTRLIDPDATRERERLYGSSPFGLIVTNAGGVSRRAGLLPNDLLLTVDGERLWGPYVLDRHLVLGPARILLKRAGEVREVTMAYANAKYMRDHPEETAH